MSDELDIRAGGAISVDTQTLRDTAGRLTRAASDCGHLADQLRRAGEASRDAGLLDPAPARRAEQAQTVAERLARALRDRAEVYELIELEAAGRVTSHEGAVARLSARLLTLARPGVAAEAARVRQEWFEGRHREVERQLFGAVTPLLSAVALLATVTAGIRRADRGVITPSDPVLAGTAAPSRVTELSRGAVRPPAGLEQLAARVPGEGESRVRVELYVTAAGEREYIVYIAGTQSAGFGGGDPWDMASNVELYTGSRSSSYEAVQQAMAAAGAGAGDRVHIVGHSQGGMIATHLAREGGYDVATLVTFATPVEAQLDGEVLAVTVRHTDDPVVALAVGGVPVVGGSRDSFIVERVADPVPRPADLAFGVHQMDAYRETAALVDASDDPRVEGLRQQLSVLGSAVTSTAIVYGATREADTARVRAPTAGASRRVSASSAAAAG